MAKTFEKSLAKTWIVQWLLRTSIKSYRKALATKIAKENEPLEI